MITLKGIIRANGYPSHWHGDLNITAEGREFHVDSDAKAMIDEPNKPLVLSPDAYAELRKKFGGALICEPVNGYDGEGAARVITEAQQKIATLEAENADLRAQLAKAQRKG